MPPRWHDAEYAAKRLAEIKTRHYPNGDTLQMVADFDWLIDEVEYLRGRTDWLAVSTGFGTKRKD